MTHDLAIVREKAKELYELLLNCTHPKDSVVISECINRNGKDVARFDVIRHDDSDGEGTYKNLYRVEFTLDTFYQ